MSKSAGYNLFKRLANAEVILPYLELSLQADNWPDSYTIEVDSTPYSGNADGFFHASSDWSRGELYLYYKIHPETKNAKKKERRNLSSNMTLAMGSALHAVIQTQLKMAGVVASDEDIEVAFTNNKEMVRGHADGIVTLEEMGRVLLEIKTQNSRAFDFQDEPKDEWYGQTQIYMHELGLKKAVVLVVESGYPFRMKEFIIRFDPSFIEDVYDKFTRVLEAVDASEPPKTPCCSLDSEVMKKCPFNEVCWWANGKDSPQ